MIDYNKLFESANGYICKHCGLFFDEWDEESFEYHLEHSEG